MLTISKNSTHYVAHVECLWVFLEIESRMCVYLFIEYAEYAAHRNIQTMNT